LLCAALASSKDLMRQGMEGVFCNWAESSAHRDELPVALGIRSKPDCCTWQVWAGNFVDDMTTAKSIPGEIKERWRIIGEQLLPRATTTLLHGVIMVAASTPSKRGSGVRQARNTAQEIGKVGMFKEELRAMLPGATDAEQTWIRCALGETELEKLEAHSDSQTRSPNGRHFDRSSHIVNGQAARSSTSDRTSRSRETETIVDADAEYLGRRNKADPHWPFEYDPLELN
jgi:hypothetical protein